jgi:hypothetical protein
MDTRPCRGCGKGSPFIGDYIIERQCRFCWLFENDARYKALWTSQPIPNIPQTQPTISKECVEAKNGFSASEVPIFQRGPSLIQKAVNFSKAIVQHVAAGLPQASEDLIAKRLAICELCVEYFDKDRRACKHKSCGCSVDKKTPWLDQKCPISRW